LTPRGFEKEISLVKIKNSNCAFPKNIEPFKHNTKVLKASFYQLS
jgi:hypothetical protein